MSDESQKVTMTIAELDALKETVRTQTRVDGLIEFMAKRDAEDRKRFDAIFSEMRKIDTDVKAFPQRLAECQHALRTETESKYVSKKEVRAGFVAVSFIQIFIGIILMVTMKGGP